MRLEPLCNYGPPGQRAAAPGQEPGELDKSLWFRGTSGAAALATRLAAQLFEVLDALRGTPEGVALDPRFDVVLLKAILAHGARWGDAGTQLRELFQPEVGGHKIKEHIARFLGYGAVDPERVLGCTEQRATLLGFGSLTNGDAHAFQLPLPETLSGTSGLRRLTVTLAWLSPVAPTQQRYRKAQLWFSTDSDDRIAVGREDDGYDHTMVRRGTVQHEIFEGTGARAFADGDVLRIQVNCREDAPGLDDPVSYGLVVSLEVAEHVPVAVYEQVRQALRSAVPIRA